MSVIACELLILDVYGRCRQRDGALRRCQRRRSPVQEFLHDGVQ